MDEFSEQEKMDQLIAELTSGGDRPVDQPADHHLASGAWDQDAVEGAPAGGGVPETDEEDNKPFDQEALDRLLGAGPAQKKTLAPQSSTPAEAPDDGHKLLDQSELDDLFSALYEEKSPTVQEDSDQTAAAMAGEAGENSDADSDGDVEPAAVHDETDVYEPVVQDVDDQEVGGRPDGGRHPDEPLAEVAGVDRFCDEAAASAPDFTDAGDLPDLQPARGLAPKVDPLPPRGAAVWPGHRRKPAAQRFKGLIVSILAALLVAGAFGAWRYAHRGGQVPEVASLPVESDPAPVLPMAPMPEAPVPAAADGIGAKIDQIERLRDAYRIKHDEIAALQEHYRGAIADLENEIRAAAEGARDFKQAVENKRIELGLKTIQRQQAYIDTLEASARQLRIGSEELRFIRREIQTDARIVVFTESVTLDQLTEKADEALQRYARALEKSSVDLSAIPLAPLEQIWKTIAERPRAPAAADALPSVSAVVGPGGNRQIQDEICRGHFDNKHRLADLSAQAAGCLAAWKGKDLFLNALPRLSPESAARLAEWKGQWLCLNGLTDFPEAVAAELARWPGRRLSLNGIATLPAASARRLVGWPGRELELAGLQALSPEAADLLTQWQAAGGRIVTSEHFHWPQALTPK